MHHTIPELGGEHLAVFVVLGYKAERGVGSIGPASQFGGKIKKLLLGVCLENKGGGFAALAAAAIKPCPIQILKGKQGRYHLRGRERTPNPRLLFELSRLFQFSLPLLKLKFHADDESPSPHFPDE
jgi:hypothetical protein